MTDETKHDLAEDRTDLAEDRTILANEWTFAGWMRTGFAAVGIGLGFNALFQAMQPQWVPKAIATVFLIIGMFMVIAAERRACAVTARLNAHEIETFKRMNLKVISGATVLATTALIAAMWLLKIEQPGTGGA